jgi:hypothetical protein
VRNAIAYLLGNWPHHGEDRAPFARTWKVDPFSSGAVFFDWQELSGSPVLWPLPPTYHPLISVHEVPGPADLGVALFGTCSSRTKPGAPTVLVEDCPKRSAPS